MTLHHVLPTRFGALFALHAICLIGTSQFNAPMLRQFGARRLIGMASLALSIAALAFAALVLGGMAALWPLVLLTLFIFVCLGLILAPAFLRAMEPFGAVAGTAAAIGSATQFTFSSAVTFLMGVSADGSARPMAVALAAAGCGVFVSWVYFSRTPTSRVSPEETAAVSS